MNISSTRQAFIGQPSAHRRPALKTELAETKTSPISDGVQLSQASERSLIDEFKDQSLLGQMAMVGMGSFFVGAAGFFGGVSLAMAGTVAGSPTATNVGVGIANISKVGLLGAGLTLPAGIYSVATGQSV